ncbi:MAG: TfoX/Sxy family protein [Alphaproteobacteria bacterium]|nr:TfoX/Sxy family protein [Alphaproteobacteria bacterium]MBL6953645.1 TfoX/Sxy family protein [Alphaproteobacteria bacterium]
MGAEYRRQLEHLIADASLPTNCVISYKSVFGAVGAYANGHIFMSSGKFGVALKLAEDTCAALIAAGAGKPLKYFEKGHIKRNYVVLSGCVLKDKARAQALLRQSAAFVKGI